MNEAMRAANGAARKVANEKVGNLKMLTSRLQAPDRRHPLSAGCDRFGALTDVNAYGAGEAALTRHLGQAVSECKSAGTSRHD
jgi:hypothetical protein